MKRGKGLLLETGRPVGRSWWWVLAMLTLNLAGGCTAPDAADVLVIENVTVIDGTGQAARPGQSVVIRGSRIVRVGPVEDVRSRGGVRVDGTGAFVIPGLWDMHVHLSYAGRAALPQLILNGVTGVRDLGGDLATVRDFEAGIASGALIGPRILAAGTIIEDSGWLDALAALPVPAIADFLGSTPRIGITTPEDARAAVARLDAEGVDLVKLRSTPPKEAFLALATAANEHGLPFVAHLPVGSDIEVVEGIEAGLDGIEHIDLIARLLDTLGPEERSALLRDIAATGAHITPTLVAMVHGTLDPAAVRAVVEDSLGVLDPRRRTISGELIEFWRLQQALDEFDAPRDSAAVFYRYARYVGEMQTFGVRIVTGTDLGVRLVYPGASVHDELALLVERAGLTPLEALRAATEEAAIAAGVADSIGVIREGYVADLVLLDADPSNDIRNSRSIRAVVRGGDLLDYRDLARIRLEVR